MATQVAVVTGATGGIGSAICRALADQGADVVGVARDEAALERVGSDISRSGCRFQAMPADLLAGSVSDVIERAWQWQGGVIVLVNAAGVLLRKPEAEVTVADWDATMGLNARVPFLLMRDLGARMFEAGSGAIVNVTSIAGERVTGAPAPYQASKAALIQLTRFFAKRFAPRVRVNAVGPGYVDTDLSHDWLADPANRSWVAERTPLARLGRADEIAAVTSFLASDGASYITGQHLLVDGGWSVE